jgi:glycosyltransferase involved in cell wall biosynthesis
MRILHVTPGYKPAYRLGGPIASVAAIAERLARLGHEVTVVTTNANLDENIDVPLGVPVDVDGVRVFYFARKEPLRTLLPFLPYVSGSLGYLYAPEMRRALDELVPLADVVHTHMPFVYPTYAGARAALRHGKPLFYSQRGNFLDTHLRRRRWKKRLWLSLFEQRLIERATTLVALTEAERAAFASLAPATPSAIVPNGVDLPNEMPDAARHVRERFGVPDDALLVLFLGRLHPWKGAGALVDAFERIDMPNTFLVMAGADESNLVSRRSARVIVPGVVTGIDKEALLHRADLFALPSTGEGLSMAMLEAMAHRTAVMISPGCNFPDAESSGAGVIVEKDVTSLATALRALLADKARLQRMGDAGRALVANAYSWDAVTAALLGVYGEGVRRTSASPRR